MARKIFTLLIGMLLFFAAVAGIVGSIQRARHRVPIFQIENLSARAAASQNLVEAQVWSTELTFPG